MTPFVTSLIYSQISNFTSVFEKDITSNLGFCIKDVDADWNGAFNFSENLDFVTNCVKQIKGDVTQRICTAAEIKFYFNSFFERKSSNAQFLRPNKNCNLTSWAPGCEPGWASSVAPGVKVNLKDSKDMPARTYESQPCCEGFFCPQGITCMIRSYCPRAKLNKTTGICDPYRYQLPPGKVNHSCGGADIWADVTSSSEIFCSAGSYCPTTTQTVPCSSGHYCRLGSTAEKLCFKLSTCNPNTVNQNIHAYGLILIVNQVISTRYKRLAKSREAAARSARETAQARERWKSAKDVAKKGAMGLSQQLSRTFSRKTTNITTRAEVSTYGSCQIFKYAYGQLEKEKAMEQKNKNLTFSGVISMATDDDVRKRPPIEVAFKDLTLTLKGKKKHLMRCVTGKIMPGRVSAVMGPSGAGKTTFLSALAGKITGCTMSEENLRFSARCRLAADLPKADKVLVVERVIESLGLQAVRDSLVGTVEKRGISGGQRKRVNVGLEMVMEPSLLILDEPTSGLDSSSSNLLLRALRREALEGVNISMVVHQPSYALFKMFDDLILLAKGGLTVYHGSVKKVEEYFAGLGITVPERVNPPDHFIDILEGIVKPGSGVTVQQLPVRWMLHNGYPVPPDMMHYCDQIASSSKGKSSSADVATEQSFAGDLWQDMMFNVELQRDHIEHAFVTSHDLSNRFTPGVLRQYRYFLGRVGKQRLREARIQAADYLILLLAGAALGTLAKVSDETFGALGYTYTVIAISLLCKIAALRSFSLDKIHYWRESASGMSSLAYFLSKDTIDNFNTVIKPLVYLSMFYFFNNPRSSFQENYAVLLCLVYCVTGMAYVFAIALEPSPAQLWCVLLPVVLTLIANQDKDSHIAQLLGRFCYPKWALEAFVIANAERYSGVWLITRCGSLMQSGYDLLNWTRCLVLLILTGVICRFIAFFCLLTLQKK
ncbi:non-intrinsic ABC protein 12 [Actinidia rufa]|uniref:Non-intrinsic ABC protein 12 n=1 Tax=Actinidia rufa TaxID=165716 RepID=A0A7J0GU52_9ERIC|nr:non-intrinsic ABC protein 12 [Actinidia rufa]